MDYRTRNSWECLGQTGCQSCLGLSLILRQVFPCVAQLASSKCLLAHSLPCWQPWQQSCLWLLLYPGRVRGGQPCPNPETKIEEGGCSHLEGNQGHQASQNKIQLPILDSVWGLQEELYTYSGMHAYRYTCTYIHTLT